jgi:hypothetical protein
MEEKEPITLDELIKQLVELSKQGYGNMPVSANLEYYVSGVSLAATNVLGFYSIDFDCYL